MNRRLARAPIIFRPRAGAWIFLLVTALSFRGVATGLPPSITLQPQSQTNVVGGNVTFTAAATGSGTLSYQWRFNGANLAGATGTSLTLTNIQLHQIGNYSMQARSGALSATSSNAYLAVLVPPLITGQPSNRVVQVGGTAVFSVQASGTEPFNYQWRFNSLDLPGANNRVLIISNAQPANSGRYQVTVNNLAGSATSIDVTLTVTTAGGFILAPLGGFGSLLTNNLNSSTQMEFICNVPTAGPVGLGLKPIEDGGLFVFDTLGSDIQTVLSVYTRGPTGDLKLLACAAPTAPDGTAGGTVGGTTGVSLRLPAVGNEDYLVRVDGFNGQRGPVTLNWKLGSPPWFTAHPQSQSVEEGASVTFFVAAGGVPEPQFQWHHNGRPLPDGTNATFTLPQVTLADAGDYVVVASNFAGVDVSLSAALNVLPFLRFDAPVLRADGLHLRVTGPPGVYWIETSADLLNWNPSIHLDAPNGVAEFIDPLALTVSQRFYRAKRF